MRDRQQVQHGVGRAAERDHHGDRVLERLARQDVARPDAALDQVDHGRAGPLGSRRACARETASCAELFGRLMPSASMAEAIVLAVYMPPQLPGPGNRRALDLAQLLVADDRPARVRADRLEDRDDVAPLRRPGRMVPP